MIIHSINGVLGTFNWYWAMTVALAAFSLSYLLTQQPATTEFRRLSRPNSRMELYLKKKSCSQIIQIRGVRCLALTPIYSGGSSIDPRNTDVTAAIDGSRIPASTGETAASQETTRRRSSARGPDPPGRFQALRLAVFCIQKTCYIFWPRKGDSYAGEHNNYGLW